MIPLQPLILMLSYIAAYKWKWQKKCNNGCICSHFELYNITKLKKEYLLRLSCIITQPFSTARTTHMHNTVRFQVQC